MFRFWSILGFFVLVAASAGCGGGGSSVPSPVAAPSSAPTPQGLPQGILYVAGVNAVSAFPLAAQGAATPSRTIGYFGGGIDANPPWTAVSAVSVGAGGSTIIGIERFSAGEDGGPPPSYGCQLYVFAAGANGADPFPNPLGAPACGGDLYPSAVVGRANGDIDYLAQPYSGQTQIIRVRASDGSSIVRLTAASGDWFADFAEDATGNIYVTNGSVAKEYNGQSDVAQPSPVRTVALSVAANFLAVAPDGTIYAAPLNSGSIEAISVSGATRTVGPFTKQIRAIATDSWGELYAGLSASGGGSAEVDVFAANASGDSPLRVLANPVVGPPDGGALTLKGIAIAQ